MMCPNCGENISNVELIENDWYGSGYYDRVEGTCPNCGKNWRWTEVYKYAFDENIEEITED